MSQRRAFPPGMLCAYLHDDREITFLVDDEQEYQAIRGQRGYGFRGAVAVSDVRWRSNNHRIGGGEHMTLRLYGRSCGADCVCALAAFPAISDYRDPRELALAER